MSSRNEVHINSALQLLQARKEALDRMHRAPMRPHGKVLGKDLFTWFDYQIEDLISTMMSFPYPIHWIAKTREVEAALRFSSEITEKLETITLYDSPKFQIDNEYANLITNCISADSMESALTMIRAIESEKGVLMITGETSDWESNKERIETFTQRFKK